MWIAIWKSGAIPSHLDVVPLEESTTKVQSQL
jgi:hypothetical protein